MHSHQVIRSRIPRGEPGTWVTLEKMEQITQEAAGDPRIRHLAFRILDNAGIESGDKPGEVQALYNWVRDELSYRKDPFRLELLTHPVATLDYGGGDCDDRSLLLSSLLRTVGYPTRYLTSSNLPGRRPPFRHVFLEAQIPRIGWIPLDPTKKLQAGSVYPGTTRVSRPLRTGGFKEMAELIPYSQSFRVPRRVIEDGTSFSLGIMAEEGQFVILPEYGGYGDDELSGFFKSLFKKVAKPFKFVKKKILSPVSKLVGKVSSIPVVGKFLPAATALIPGLGPMAALAAKTAGIRSMASKLIPTGARSAITESARAAFLEPAAAPAAPAATATRIPAVTARPAVFPVAPSARPFRASAVTAGILPASQFIPGVSNKMLVAGAILLLLLPRVLGKR